MKIDFNQVLAAAMPEGRVEIEHDGKTFTVKDPSVLDVAGFDAVRERMKGESEEAHSTRILAFLRGWFEGEAPAFLSDALPTDPRERRKLLGKVTALSQVIAVAINDMSALPNVMARSQRETRAQIERARSGSDS